MRLAVLAFCCLALAACVPGGAGQGAGKTPAKGASPITGGEVTVTPLTPPPGAGAATPPSAPPAPGPAPDPAKVPPPGAEAAKGEVAQGETPKGTPPKGDVTVVMPPTSPEEAACRKEGGSWAKVGKGGRTCLKSTRDSGKSCSSGTQCEGLCLARSGTCAPLKPMFGCNEIFQDDGQRVTLCID